MKYVFNKLKMENILKFIEKRGYYYIQTEKLYDHFTGPRYIVITTDPDFAKKHPRLAKMIIMTPEEFEPMIAIYNEWIGNERLADDRQRRYHNDEGYYEDCDTDEEGNGDFLKIRDLPLNPVVDELEERELKKMVREAMATLNEKQYQRIYCYYFKGMTYRQIGKTEWNTGNIRNILTNEKYVGDVLMQKTFTIDCITHKKVKNNGERAMYLASNCHPAIIDRDTFNLVQQELARRNAKRKVSTKTVTEQGKYSSKYALTELMICGECGTPYRRCTWNVHGKKQIVWRCISRLDHGSKYCKSSPTIHEEPLHGAIIQAVNEFYDCGDDVAKILKANVESVLAGMEQSEIQKIEQRLKDIDKARNDMISLITSGTCDEDTLDAEYKNCRTHLLKHLTGDIAWRHLEDGVAQCERLRQERIAERERSQQNESPCDERVATVCDDRQEVGETPDENLEAAVSDCDGFEETEDEGMTMSM